jgi:hypothetical protein
LLFGAFQKAGSISYMHFFIQILLLHSILLQPLADPMRLKYEKQIDALTHEGVQCSLEGFIERDNRECFRWVFSDINDERNFIPIYKAPGRIESDRTLKKLTCYGWSLSLFTNKDKAKNRWRELVAINPKLSKKLGDHICEGVIQKQHGLSNKENAISHFELFEYDNVNLIPHFDTPEKINTI